MRSVYAKILVWGIGTTALCLIASYLFSNWFIMRAGGREGPFGGFAQLQLEESVEAYETGGQPALKKYMDKIARLFHANHHLVNAAGKDLLTGEDFSQLLSRIPLRDPAPHREGDKFIINRVSADGKYVWLVLGRPPFRQWAFVPYYLLILVSVALVCWLLASRIAAPLRELNSAVQRFGHGELDARVRSNGRDEIGALSQSFDQMADRIQTLLVAERRLLQDISHELRSPLARLSFAAELIRTAPDREAAVARLRKEIERLTSLVASLIEVTRAEGDPSDQPSSVLRLDQLLGQVVEDCQLDAQSHNCGISYRPSTQITVRGNQELLRRAVENILRNAIRHTPAGTNVEVFIQTNSKEAEVTLRDQGTGVPEASLGRIFDPFYRVDDSRDGASGGVGLGLAIARRAVLVHHGTIQAENSNPGLRVVIRIPLANAPVH